MIVSLPAVVVLGVIVGLLVSKGVLRVAHALVCLLLGFYLADSRAAPTINNFTRSVADVLSQVRF